jgi:hypothetical protein
MLGWIKDLFREKVVVQDLNHLASLCWDYSLEGLENAFQQIRKHMILHDGYIGDESAKPFVYAQLMSFRVHSFIGIKHYYFSAWSQPEFEQIMKDKYSDWVDEVLMPISENYKNSVKLPSHEDTRESFMMIDNFENLFASYSKELMSGEHDKVSDEVSKITSFGIMKVTCFLEDDSFDPHNILNSKIRVDIMGVAARILLEVHSVTKKLRRLKLVE